MGGPFAKTDMSATEFHEEFHEEVFENYHAAWTLFAKSAKNKEIGDVIPIGSVLGFWSHPNPEKAPFMIIGDMLWFPWASPRNRVETAVSFFNEIRYEMPVVEYARQKDKKFFEMLMKHGVMNRVGKTHSVYADEPAIIYETRRSLS